MNAIFTIGRFAVWFGLLLASLSQRALAQPVPPSPPLAASPVAVFRMLLATNETGRAVFFANRQPERRTALEAKLAEYLALTPEQRELRLTLTELRWYLPQFLILNEGIRSQSLSQLPARLRPLIEERLQHWDRLPENSRQRIMTNETAMSSLVRFEKTPLPPTPPGLVSLPTFDRQSIESVLTAWQSLPEVKRHEMTTRFARFFDLDNKQKTRTLRELPVEERQLVEQTLGAFERLPKDEREKCLASFQLFSQMSPDERRQFLDNAARWQAMNPKQQQAVRQAARYTPPMPPMPPGLLPPDIRTAALINPR